MSSSLLYSLNDPCIYHIWERKWEVRKESCRRGGGGIAEGEEVTVEEEWGTC